VQEGSKLTVTPKSGTAYDVVVPNILTQVYQDMKAAADAGNIKLPPDIYTVKDAPDNGWISILITGLLLREHDRTGRIAFLAFYARRARRLLPAAIVVLVATLISVGSWLPALVQRFVVNPNPLVSERPFLRRSIAATRSLDCNRCNQPILNGRHRALSQQLRRLFGVVGQDDAGTGAAD